MVYTVRILADQRARVLDIWQSTRCFTWYRSYSEMSTLQSPVLNMCTTNVIKSSRHGRENNNVLQKIQREQPWKNIKRCEWGQGDVLPQTILKIESPKMWFSGLWGLNWGQKSMLFHSRKSVSLSLNFWSISHNQFLQAMNKWWKLNYVLLHINKFCVNLSRNLWKLTET